MDQIYHSLFENAAIGISVVSRERRFLKVNPFFCRMLGYTEAELLQKNVSDITLPEDMEENVRQDDRVVKGEQEHFTMEKRYVRKDGSVFWVLLTVTMQTTSQGDQVFLAQAQDIQAQKDLEEVAKLEALSALQTSYNHEINNPLTIALRLTSQLENRFPAMPEIPKLREALDRIVKAIRSVTDMMQSGKIDLTTYSGDLKMLQLDAKDRS